jgi:hypothetical protein
LTRTPPATVYARSARSGRCALGLAAIAGLAAPLPALAQLATPAPPTAAASADRTFTGRDFAGLTLAGPVQSGGIPLVANRATQWTEADGTQRLFLQGDVRVSLGLFSFHAAQAAVWIRQIDAGRPGVEGGPAAIDPTWQVAVYLDRLGAAATEYGSTQSGDRLLVTAVVKGPLSLKADLLRSGRAVDPVVIEGEARLANLLARLATPGDQPAPEVPVPAPVGSPVVAGLGPIRPGIDRPFEPNSPYARAPRPSAAALTVVPAGPTPIFAGGGQLTFAAGEPTLIGGSGEEETVLKITGGVVVAYTDARRARSLQLTAQNAVVFFTPGKLEDLFSAPEDRVVGIYLEGDVVATDGRFTLRAPQAYYDVQANRAYAADAVFWTYDELKEMPLYVRARSLKQTAANQITGEGVTLANSSFFTPHFSMGARTLTVTRTEGDGVAGRPAQTVVDGRGLTLNAGRLPFFYWPSFSGDVERFPLKEIGFENSSGSGAGIKTRWDLFGLIGQDPPPGVELDLLLDGFLDRGIGLGTESRWQNSDSRGDLLAYLVPSDRGRDTLSSGEKVDRDDETRGLLLGEHSWKLDQTWTLQLEGSYISDQNFIDAYYDPLGETRREFASSAYIRALDGNSRFDLLAKGSFNNFLANEYLLQSQGFSVDKLPELTYARTADDPLFFAAPGWLNWSQEWRLGMMAFNFTEKRPTDYGFSTVTNAASAFGPGAFGFDNVSVGPNQRIDSALIARGLSENSTARFDTRHDLSAPLKFGPVNVTPFGTGRYTMYDDRFGQYRAFADPTNDEKHRYWYAGGVHIDTSIQRVDDSVRSEFFDVNRVRHILSPSATVWTAGTNIRREENPIYDEYVEGISEGTAFRVGATNTWQTQRGGPLSPRTVDFLVLRTDYIHATDDTERKSPLARFFDYRPEHSVFGDAFNIDSIWQATDATAFTVNYVYDLDRNQPARTTAGLRLDHTVDFSSFLEVHYLNPRDATFVSFGANYRLTELYTVGADATYDVDEERFQFLGGRINRELPGMVVSVRLAYNDITSEFSAGVAVQPTGRDRRREQLRRLGRDQLDIGQPPPDTGTQAQGSLFK